MFAILSRDAARLVDSYDNLGFLLPGADKARIVEATEATFEQVWGLTMEEMRNANYDTVSNLAGEFNDLIFDMPFYMPQDFIYLGRTIGILSGMCTNLDPQYNPWDELEPYTETLIARGFGINIPKGQMLTDNIPGAIIQSVFSGNAQTTVKLLAEESRRRFLGPLTDAEDTMRRLQRGDIRVKADLPPSYEQQLKRLERETRRNSRMMWFGSLLITSTLFYTHGDTTIAIIGYGLCGLTWLLGILSD